jgi:hypothetical protein
MTQEIERIRDTRLTVEDTTNLSFFIDTAKFEQAQRIAKLMAAASLMPKHLKGSTPEEAIANSFLVVNQAFTWGINPFAVAQETYVVQGNLGYQGKLVAAIINTKARLKERLRYEYNDQPGDKLEITVIGTFQGEDAPRTTTLSVGQAKTQNQMWAKDPRQKLIYSGVIKWARAHAPELILGVATDDDIDAIVSRSEERRIEIPAFTPPKPKSKADQIKDQIPAAEPIKAESKKLTGLGQVLDLCERDDVKPMAVWNWLVENEPSVTKGISALTEVADRNLKLLADQWHQLGMPLLKEGEE